MDKEREEGVRDLGGMAPLLFNEALRDPGVFMRKNGMAGAFHLPLKHRCFIYTVHQKHVLCNFLKRGA